MVQGAIAQACARMVVGGFCLMGSPGCDGKCRFLGKA